MVNSPVLFIIFNRPSTTSKVFEAIKKAQPKTLYIASDAPRENNSNDILQCKLVREIVSDVDWNCNVKRLYQTINLGCSHGVQAAFKWFFSEEPMGIILEDDCLPSTSFFKFCDEMLLKYQDDHKIISINGCNLGYELKTGKSYNYSRFLNMWGWATWKRSADKIDYQIKDWKIERSPILKIWKKVRQNFFDFDINWFIYWKDKFDLVSNDDAFTWDYQWIYYQMMNSKYSIVPALNLVTNLGFNSEATHTLAENNPAANMPLKEIDFPLVYNNVKKIDLKYEEKFVKWVWSYHQRLPLSFYLKKMLSKILKPQ